MTMEYQEAHLVKKIFAGLIDAALVLGSLLLLLNKMSKDAAYNIPIITMHPTVMLLVVLALYRFIFLLLFNGTVGMKLFGIFFLNVEMEPLNTSEKFLAAFFILYRGVDYYERTKLV